MDKASAGRRLLVSDWQRIEPFVDAALDSAPGERDATINAVCQGDESDIALVRAFLRNCDAVDELLDRPAIETFAAIFDDDDHTRSLPETLANRYRIAGEIGAGGMAVVYRAHDMTLNRRVAVKVVKEMVNSASYAERFLAEIHTTARLTHPHIVPVFDSGEAERVLYFVMPYCDGGSLAGRLEQTPQLPLEEALHIGSDIASALDYAHAAGFVHRDIKPSNILFSSGRALLSDFGIARGIDSDDESLTASGFVVGTPDYMSPEQRSGARTVDPRSDIYSFACVVYAMLSGEVPPSASTRLVMAKRGVDPLVPLSTLRPELSSRANDCLVRAMALSASDRYQSATQFMHELAAAIGSFPLTPNANGRTAHRPWRRTVLLTSVATIAIVLSIAAAFAFRTTSAGAASTAVPRVAAIPTTAEPLDTARFVVLPYENGDTSLVSGAQDGLIDALRRWNGISIADSYRLSELLARAPAGTIATERARGIARTLGAGRFIRRRISRSGATSRLTASLYSAADGALLREATAPLSIEEAGNDSAFRALAAGLLFDANDNDAVNRARETRSRPALQLFERGAAAVRQWELERAESAFVAASQVDTAFASAHLRIAQVRMWRGLPLAAWRMEAVRANAQRTRLSAPDRVAAEIIDAYGKGDTTRACARWNASALGTDDFAAWYSAALCEMRDRVVIRDRRSPSGWRFRSSYAHSLRALSRAFEIMPSIHREFRSSLYWELGRTLNISQTQFRIGFAQAPDTGLFAAYPSWSAAGDSLLFIPRPIALFDAGDPRTIPATLGDAIQRQRLVFREIATVWHNAFPRDADAMLAVAISLDELGDLSAMDSVAVARRLATEPAEELRAASTEVWLRVKHGAPSDVRSLEIARALADSLLRTHPAPRGAEVAPLTALALLLGHASQAAAFARRENVEDELTPGTLRATGQALLAFAAAGQPVDSLRRLTQEVDGTIDVSINEKQKVRVRARWLGRAVMLAFPTVPTSLIWKLSGEGDALADAEGAFFRHDSATALRAIRDLHERRRILSPEEVKLEAAYPESWLLAALGDSVAALKGLSAPLDALNRTTAERVSDPTGAGALVRSMALRAQLDHSLGNRASAVEWARSVIALWSGADRELQTTVLRTMKALAQ